MLLSRIAITQCCAAPLALADVIAKIMKERLKDGGKIEWEGEREGGRVNENRKENGRT